MTEVQVELALGLRGVVKQPTYSVLCGIEDSPDREVAAPLSFISPPYIYLRFRHLNAFWLAKLVCGKANLRTSCSLWRMYVSTFNFYFSSEMFLFHMEIKYSFSYSKSQTQVPAGDCFTVFIPALKIILISVPIFI